MKLILSFLILLILNSFFSSPSGFFFSGHPFPINQRPNRTAAFQFSSSVLASTIAPTIAKAPIVEDGEPGPLLITHRAPKRRTSRATPQLAGAGHLPSDALLL